MKKTLTILIAVSTLAFSLVACSAPSDSVTTGQLEIPNITAAKTEPPESTDDVMGEDFSIPKSETSDEDEVFVSEVDLVSFSTIDEFNAYIKNAKTGEDIADLANLEDYYLPIGLPEKYKLYKITAGVVDIGFWYLPEDYITSEEKIIDGEATQKHFLFISPRTQYDFDEVKNQYEIQSSKAINDKYYVADTGISTVLWEENGDVLMMYTPIDETESFLNNTTIEKSLSVEHVKVQR